jgi:hypothetical protein
VSFALTTDDALLIWDDGEVTGFPADTVVDADAALRSDTVASTPTGPWYDHGTPEHAYLTLYRLLPGAHVSGDAPEIPTYPDELGGDEALVEARWDPHVHPRGRGGRWIDRPWHSLRDESMEPGDVPQDTPQQKAVLRQNRTARTVRERFPVGTRVIVTPGAGAEPRPGAQMGTVRRHVPQTNAQGGYLVVAWDSGVEGRISPGSVRSVGESHEPGLPSISDLLDSLERQAHANEATVTPVLQQVVAAQGGRMEGLHNRLKTREGIESKFRRRRRIMPDATDAEVAGAVNDALRYTAVFPDDRYVTGIEQTLEALREAGFTADQIENFWSSDNNYVGVHALVRDRTGFGFELQFHTPESFETKQGEHVLYEQMRETDNPATARRLYDQMVGIAQRVVRPVRVEQVGVLAPRLAPAFG